MKDRVPVYPGRVKLVPVSGQENVYDMTRADQPTQEGDPLNKATLLKDATAALYGLGTDAVPDDVLALLSEASLARVKTETTGTSLNDLSDGDEFSVDGFLFRIASKTYNQEGSSGVLVQVLHNESFENLIKWNDSRTGKYEGGALDTYLTETLFNKLPQKIRDSAINANMGVVDNRYQEDYDSRKIIQRKIIAPSYSWFSNSGAPDAKEVNRNYKLFHSSYISASANFAWTRTPGDSSEPTKAVVVTTLTADESNGFETRYKNSTVYPLAFILLPLDFKINEVTTTSGGLYDVSGNLLLKLPGVQIATGSYVGTGKYGPDNPNSLTFEFPPKLLFITQCNGDGNFYGDNSIDGNPMDCSILTTSYTAGLGFSNVSSSDGLSGYAKKTEDGKTITWYHSRSEDSQANYAQYTYYYFAIG